MLADVESGATLDPAAPERDAAEALVRAKRPEFVSYEDWRAIDTLEIQAGENADRPRVKFTAVEDVLAALRG